MWWSNETHLRWDKEIKCMEKYFLDQTMGPFHVPKQPKPVYVSLVDNPLRMCCSRVQKYVLHHTMGPFHFQKQSKQVYGNRAAYYRNISTYNFHYETFLCSKQAKPVYVCIVANNRNTSYNRGWPFHIQKQPKPIYMYAHVVH